MQKPTSTEILEHPAVREEAEAACGGEHTRQAPPLALSRNDLSGSSDTQSLARKPTFAGTKARGAEAVIVLVCSDVNWSRWPRRHVNRGSLVGRTNASRKRLI